MGNEVFLLGQGLIAVLCGFIVEGIKRAGLPGKYAMLVSAGVGLLLGLAAWLLLESVTLTTGLFGGLLAGAVASGFYSGGKKVKKALGK